MSLLVNRFTKLSLSRPSQAVFARTIRISALAGEDEKPNSDDADATPKETAAPTGPPKKMARRAFRMALKDMYSGTVPKDAMLSFNKRDELFTLHQADPVKWNFEVLAQKYGILPRRAMAIVQLKKLELEAEKSGWTFTNSAEGIIGDYYEMKDKLNENATARNTPIEYNDYVIAKRPLDMELVKVEKEPEFKTTFAQKEREKWKFEDTAEYIRGYGQSLVNAKAAGEQTEKTDQAEAESAKKEKAPKRSKWTFIESGSKRLDGTHITPSNRTIKVLEKSGTLREANSNERTFINVVYKTTPVVKTHRHSDPMKVRRIERIISVLD
eukprot:TRINITY_DN660_c0_g1_i1.p1 TRINITY_DN660_c0_g1~~TRINITY_DN660_c0_g1_i1.p1  ORF type:complete len:326 (-),score=84.10 TRINITY_DN660_c0_g1_i1:287-1264(-)